MKTILTTSYSPQIQGSYGLVMRHLMSRVHASGKYKIISHAWLHADLVENVPWQVIPTEVKVMPDGNHALDEADKWGERSFGKVLAHVKPDIVFALGDQYMLRHVGAFKSQYPTVQFIFYLAVDGEPWHPGLTHDFTHGDHIFALSKFGSDTLAPLLSRPVPWIYHGYNQEVFKYLGDGYKANCRKELCPTIDPDAFIIGWVGKNQFRKQVYKFWELLYYLKNGTYIRCNACDRVTLMELDKRRGSVRSLDALRMYDNGYDYTYCWYCGGNDIVEGKPNNKVFGWSHMPPCHPNDGWNSDQLSALWRLNDRMIFTPGLKPNKGLSDQDMLKIYSLFDIFYCMSGGEGFGIPVLESMASGVPVMYSNYSAHAEVVGNAGIPVRVNFISEHASLFDRANIDTADAIAKMLPLIEDKTKLKPYIDKGLQRAKTFTWDQVAAQLISYFDSISANVKHTLGKVV